MARGNTGTWVTRAGSTGGGRSYRGQRPVKWYLSLFLIVVLGLVAVAYSRYEDQHPSTTAQPAVGTKWYSALAIDVCGTMAANLATNPNEASAAPGLHTEGDGIIYTEPLKSADAGANATLARFVALYPKLHLTSTTLQLPGKQGLSNGQVCPAGTPDKGKSGAVQIKVWPSFSGSGANHPVSYSDPADVKLANGQLITVAFVPSGASVPKPVGQTIVTLLNLIETATAGTTTVPATVATTVPATTATTVPATTPTTTKSATATTTATTTAK